MICKEIVKKWKYPRCATMFSMESKDVIMLARKDIEMFFDKVAKLEGKIVDLEKKLNEMHEKEAGASLWRGS